MTREWFHTAATSNTDSVQFELTGKFHSIQKGVSYSWKINHPNLSVDCSQVPHPRPDRLWINSFGSQPFLGVSDGLRFSAYYNFQPQAIRQLQKPAPGAMLVRDGSNIASLIESVREIDEATISRVGEYLSVVVDEVDGFYVMRYGDYETVRFRLRAVKQNSTLEFDATSMSDGTLRVLAALMAAFQIHRPSGPTVIGIEEPETSLHPAAMRVLVDALDEATLRTQILLTTQR